jgi:hypothetical protein
MKPCSETGETSRLRIDSNRSSDKAASSLVGDSFMFLDSKQYPSSSLVVEEGALPSHITACVPVSMNVNEVSSGKNDDIAQEVGEVDVTINKPVDALGMNSKLQEVDIGCVGNTSLTQVTDVIPKENSQISGSGRNALLEAIRSRNRPRKDTLQGGSSSKGVRSVSDDVDMDSGRGALLSAIRNRQQGGISEKREVKPCDSNIFIGSTEPVNTASPPCEGTSDPECGFPNDAANGNDLVPLVEMKPCSETGESSRLRIDSNRSSDKAAPSLVGDSFMFLDSKQYPSTALIVEEGALQSHFTACVPVSMNDNEVSSGKNDDIAQEVDEVDVTIHKPVDALGMNSKLQEVDIGSMGKKSLTQVTEVIPKENSEISGSGRNALLEAIRSRNRPKKDTLQGGSSSKGTRSVSDDADMDSVRSALLSAIRHRRQGGISVKSEGKSLELIGPVSSIDFGSTYFVPINNSFNCNQQISEGGSRISVEDSFSDVLLLSGVNNPLGASLQLSSNVVQMLPSAVSHEKGSIGDASMDAPYDELGEKRKTLLTAIRDRNNRRRKPSLGTLHGFSN